jgi:hypothetical protein
MAMTTCARARARTLVYKLASDRNATKAITFLSQVDLLEIWIGLICITIHWKNLTSERVEETGPKTDMMLKREFVYFVKGGSS